MEDEAPEPAVERIGSWSRSILTIIMETQLSFFAWWLSSKTLKCDIKTCRILTLMLYVPLLIYTKNQPKLRIPCARQTRKQKISSKNKGMATFWERKKQREMPYPASVPSHPKFYILNGMVLRLDMAFPLVSLLFQEVEYDRSSLNPCYFLEEIFYFLVDIAWQSVLYMYKTWGAQP